MQKAPRAALLLVVISLMLGGCGFQLRGATAVPAALNPLYVDCSGGTPASLCEQVRELLVLNEMEVLEERTDNSYVLRLTGLTRTQRATAITDSAAAAEYDLRLRSTISLLAPGSVPLLANATVMANEIYRYDEENVLAKRREQQDLTEQLYQRLAQQIVFRLTPFTARHIDQLRTEHEAGQADQPEPAAQVPGN